MLVPNRYLNWAEDPLRETLPERLETWGERLMEASRLEEVFESKGEY